MEKTKRIYLLIGLLIIFIIGSIYVFNNNFYSSRNWSYIFQGSSEHWEGKLIVKPSNDGSEVIFEGVLVPLQRMKINELTYKADLVHNQITGAITSPLIQEGKPIQIFITEPGRDTIKFRQEMSPEEIAQIFHRDLSFEITWQDETGQKIAKIVLNLQKS